MRTDITKEAIASEALYDYFQAAPCSTVHSWHPPDSKAYFTRLLYIPQNGKRSHVDLIVQIASTLYLIEVKDRLSNSYDDVRKLKQITESVPTPALVKRFQQQGLRFQDIPLRTDIVIAAKEPDDEFIKRNPDIAIILADQDRIQSAGELGRSLLEQSSRFSRIRT